MERKVINCLSPALITLLLTLALFSCQQTSDAENKDAPDEVEALRQEVMGVHDAIMPGVGTLMSLKKRLREQAAQLDTTKEADKEKAAAITAAIKDLEAADEAMMQWMRIYQDPSQAEGKPKRWNTWSLRKMRY